MKIKKLSFHIGLRTVKTAVAAILAMVIVSMWGTTDSRLIFAMLGAMAAVEPTFKESVQSSLTQIVGVLFGALISVVLLQLPLPRLVIAGIGIVLVITLYNTFHITYSPGLPCFMVVFLATSENVEPMSHAFGRLWDTAIGLGVGMAINMLVFPYDNSRRIRQTAEHLDVELLRFLEELFDGDAIIPDAEMMAKRIDELDKQLKIFSAQKLFTHLKRQHKELEKYRLFQQKARLLVAQLEVLTQMGQPGCLSEDNRSALLSAGADIQDKRTSLQMTPQDVVTNYHVGQILSIRAELLEVL